MAHIMDNKIVYCLMATLRALSGLQTVGPISLRHRAFSLLTHNLLRFLDDILHRKAKEREQLLGGR